MEITAEMLFYRLSEKYTLQIEHIGAPGLAVCGIRPWQKGMAWEAGIFYLLNGEYRLPERTAKEPGCFLVCNPRKASLQDFLPEDTYAVLDKAAPQELLHTELLELYSRLIRWDARFSQAILHKEDARTIMSWGREMLDWGYAVIDADLKNLYSTPDYAVGWVEDTDDMPREFSHALMMNPNFHAVADLRESFYYYMELNDLDALCGNIFVGGVYYARAVMYVGPKGCRIHAGARALFDRFTAHLEELFQYSTDFIGRGARDQLHDLFLALAAGEKPALFIQSNVLKKVGWKNDDQYMVIQLRFYEAAGWNTQLATTLPYLARELELEWHDSCAVIDGLAIQWLINISRSGEAKDQHVFHQRVASFVREHVCHAGISPRFRDFSLIPYAVRAADAAFRLGQTRNPHFWYYLFDDYRLEYMLEKTGEELPPSILCHPAILKLMVYDEEHRTELAQTLHIYLRCNLNMTAAAEKLYIHRTTFCRRMAHIRQLTGLDIQDADTILSLLMSYRLLNF